MIVTSYGRNKNLDDEINKKNQEKANNSLSYRFAAIKNRMDWPEVVTEWNENNIAFEQSSFLLILVH